jgi:AcrR family transcriptional regulator
VVARRRTPSEDLEPAILAAAESLLDDEGPGALSIRRIAACARVAPMGLYSRFDGKHGVVDALFQEGFDALGSTIRATAQLADPVAAFREAGLAYRALALAHPARYRLMFLDAVPGFTPSEASIETASGAFGSLVEAAARCVEAGALRPLDAAAIAQQVWAACHGWVALELGGINFADDRDAGYAELLDVLLRGLAAEPDVAATGAGQRPSRSGDRSIEV